MHERYRFRGPEGSLDNVCSPRIVPQSHDGLQQRSNLAAVGRYSRADHVALLLVCPTPGISCERPRAPARDCPSARKPTPAIRALGHGALVSFIPLFGCTVGSAPCSTP